MTVIVIVECSGRVTRDAIAIRHKRTTNPMRGGTQGTRLQAAAPTYSAATESGTALRLLPGFDVSIAPDRVTITITSLLLIALR